MTKLKNIWGEDNDRPFKVEGPCFNRALNATLLGAGGGTFFAAVQLAWFPDPVAPPTGGAAAKRFAANAVLGPRDIMRAISRPAFWMGSASATFATVECLAESLREKKDPWNAAIGGFASGLVCGAITKRADFMVSTAFGLGLFMFALDYGGPSVVHESSQHDLRNKMYGVLPKAHKESDALAALKEKYPECKEL